MDCIRTGDGFVTVEVKVQPKARRQGTLGLGTDGRLRIAVNAAPEDGKANKAVIGVLAKSLGVPARAIEVIAGATAREKTLRITGDPAGLAAKLGALG